MSTPPPLIHAMSTNSKYEVEKTWQLIEPSGGFKGVRVEKRGNQYRIPGSCLVNYDCKGAGIRLIANLPADIPRPKNACPAICLGTFTTGVRIIFPLWVTNDGRFVISVNTGGTALIYFPDIVWYADECE